eukprot:365540-Chlamydomonas_euryale.AAC.9
MQLIGVALRKQMQLIGVARRKQVQLIGVAAIPNLDRPPRTRRSHPKPSLATPNLARGGAGLARHQGFRSLEFVTLPVLQKAVPPEWTWRSHENVRVRLQVTLARVVETGQLVAVKRIHVRKATADTLPDNVLREIKALQVGGDGALLWGKVGVVGRLA